MRKKISLTITVLAVVGLFAAHVQAAPTVTITSPADGDTISRGANPTFTMAGDVSFDTPTPTSQKYFVRRATCSTAASDQMRLSIVQGTDSGGCGTLGSITPLNEIGSTVGVVAPAVDIYPAVDGLPLTLDASRPVTGQITLSSFQPGVEAGGGTVTIDITLTGDSATIGTTSVSYTVLPTQPPVASTFSIQPPASLDKRDFGAITLSVRVRGVHAAHGYFSYNGASFVTLPTYSASFDRRVQTQVNSGPWVNATVGAELDDWSATVNTPGVGSHFIRARAVQGGVTSAAVTQVLHVTA